MPLWTRFMPVSCNFWISSKCACMPHCEKMKSCTSFLKCLLKDLVIIWQNNPFPFGYRSMPVVYALWSWPTGLCITLYRISSYFSLLPSPKISVTVCIISPRMDAPCFPHFIFCSPFQFWCSSFLCAVAIVYSWWKSLFQLYDQIRRCSRMYTYSFHIFPLPLL